MQRDFYYVYSRENKKPKNKVVQKNGLYKTIINL